MRKLILTLAAVICLPCLAMAKESVSASKYNAEQVYCLAKNIYHESRGEPFEGQEAVAWVVLNRTETDEYPDTICGVVYDKKQFSWVANAPEIDEPRAWQRSIEVAKYVIAQHSRNEYDPTGGAIMFHEKGSTPYWVKHYRKVFAIGDHIFYN